ncbi:MAG: FAD-dependent oxidoreductase, partial [Candidatus Micrarchaeia archaeon]
MDVETHVIGAGVAGLVLARDLAEKGVSVTVYDKKERPGMPDTASGILSIKGLDSLGIPYMNAVRNTLYGARIHAGRAVMEIKAKEPQARVLDRPTLNDICVDVAEKAGAKLSLGKQIGVDQLNEFSKSGILVGADGANSLVSKHFGMGSIEDYVLTYKAKFEFPNDDHSVDLFFDNSVAPGLFAWLCPLSKYEIEAGLGIGARHGNSRTAFERFMAKYARNEIGKAKMLEAHASIIPISTRKRIVDEARKVLLVGDAAGQVKASTGGGIIYGGNAARIAAKAIYACIRKGEPLSNYEREFYRKFGVDMKLHRLIRLLYSSLSPGMMQMLVGTLARLGVGEALGKHGDMDSPSTTLKRLL